MEFIGVGAWSWNSADAAAFAALEGSALHRIPLAFVFAVLLASCSYRRGPGGEVGKRIDSTREKIASLRETHRSAADDIQQLRTQAEIVRLETEMLRDFGHSAFGPAFSLAPPDESLPPPGFIAGSLTYELKVQEGFEEVWLLLAVPESLPDVTEVVESGRRMHEECLATYARQNGRAYDLTPEQRGYVRSVVALRATQLLTEASAECRAFLETSRAWWAARCPVPP